MKIIPAVLALLLVPALAFAAGIGVENLVLTSLGPTLPGGSSSANVTAIDPITGDVWMSNGQTLFRNDGAGGWFPGESVLAAGGGPIPNASGTADMAFDAAGRQYVSDIGTGEVFRRTLPGGAWTLFTDLPGPVRHHRWGPDGVLYAIGGIGLDPTTQSIVWKVDGAGAFTVLGLTLTGAESFDFDAANHLVIPHFDSTGVDLMNRTTGLLETPCTYDRPVPILFESLAVTSGGNWYVGVNRGADIGAGTGNRAALLRIDPATCAKTLIGNGPLGIGSAGEILPVDMLALNATTLVISGLGSLDGFGLSGDLDGELTAIPAPAPLALLALGVALVALARRRRAA